MQNKKEALMSNIYTSLSRVGFGGVLDVFCFPSRLNLEALGGGVVVFLALVARRARVVAAVVDLAAGGVRLRRVMGTLLEVPPLEVLLLALLLLPVERTLLRVALVLDILIAKTQSVSK